MKKLVLPQNRMDYVPKGIYSLPKEERRNALEKIMENTEKDLTEYRINVRRRMRGEL